MHTWLMIPVMVMAERLVPLNNLCNPQSRGRNIESSKYRPAKILLCRRRGHSRFMVVSGNDVHYADRAWRRKWQNKPDEDQYPHAVLQNRANTVHEYLSDREYGQYQHRGRYYDFKHADSPPFLDLFRMLISSSISSSFNSSLSTMEEIISPILPS